MNPIAVAGVLAMALLAGWLAARLLFGKGFGVIANVLVGLMGGLLGGMAVDRWLPAIDAGLVGDLFAAFLGALALLAVLGVVRKVAA